MEKGAGEGEPEVHHALVSSLTLTAKAEEAWSSGFVGGSELGPPAMADMAVLYACERQG
jgi:hypothetical protein